MFRLHPQLAEDCFILGDFPLSQLLMMNDYHYPWFILVPRKADIREMFELDKTDQQQLNTETNNFAAMARQCFKAHKMNIAALGNMVPQLHVHVIARFDFDTSWPNPVWGRAQSLPYEKEQLIARIDQLKPALAQLDPAFEWDEQWL